jgi:hypothetical protein
MLVGEVVVLVLVLVVVAALVVVNRCPADATTADGSGKGEEV